MQETVWGTDSPYSMMPTLRNWQCKDASSRLSGKSNETACPRARDCHIKILILSKLLSVCEAQAKIECRLQTPTLKNRVFVRSDPRPLGNISKVEVNGFDMHKAHIVTHGSASATTCIYVSRSRFLFLSVIGR